MTKRVMAWTVTCAVLCGMYAEVRVEVRLARQRREHLAQYRRMTNQER